MAEDKKPTGNGRRIKLFAQGSTDSPLSASRMNEIVNCLNPLLNIQISRLAQFDNVQYADGNVIIQLAPGGEKGDKGDKGDPGPPGTGGGGSATKYELGAVFLDYLSTTGEIKIAKPPKLRMSIMQAVIFKQLVRYTYMPGPNTNNAIRVYTNSVTGAYETQMVIPLWLTAGDAVDPAQPTVMNDNDILFGLTVDDTGVDEAPTVLMTGEARQWARVEVGDLPATVSTLVSSDAGAFAGDMLGMFALSDLPSAANLTFGQAGTLAGFNFQNTTTAPVTMSWPNLLNIDAANLQGGSLQLVSNASLTSVDAPLLAAVGGFVSIFFNPLLDSVNLPALASIVGDVNITSNDVLTSVTLTALTSCPNLSVYGNPLLTTLDLSAFTAATTEAIIDFWGTTLDLSALATVGVNGLTIVGSFTSIDLSALVSVGPDAFVISDISLTSLSLPAFVPDNGLTQDFSGCALDAASVNGILHRAVLNAGYVSGSIDTTGANAAPTGTGIIDKATLIGRGVSVSTN